MNDDQLIIERERFAFFRVEQILFKVIEYKCLKYPVPLQRRATLKDVEAKRPGRQNKEPEVAKTQ